MQAVILAAGKGTRMGELSIDTPKPLLIYKGKTLLHWKIDALPPNIDEVIIVIGYLGEQIQKTFGSIYNNKKITYVWDKEIKGTGMALWQAKDVVKDKFLVMMGDDIYDRETFYKASQTEWSITVKKVSREDNSSRIEKDKNGKFINFITAEKYRSSYQDGGYAFTGLYTLSKKIFEYPLIKMKTKDEWGLPHTLLGLIKNFDIKIIETDFWKQITTIEDLM